MLPPPQHTHDRPPHPLKFNLIFSDFPSRPPGIYPHAHYQVLLDPKTLKLTDFHPIFIRTSRPLTPAPFYLHFFPNLDWIPWTFFTYTLLPVSLFLLPESSLDLWVLLECTLTDDITRSWSPTSSGLPALAGLPPEPH